MKVYKDKELTQPIKTIDLGREVAGTKTEHAFYIVNDTIFPLEIKEIKLSHPELAVKTFPKELKENETGEVIIEYAPKVDLMKKLNVDFEIDYYKVV